MLCCVATVVRGAHHSEVKTPTQHLRANRNHCVALDCSTVFKNGKQNSNTDAVEAQCKASPTCVMGKETIDAKSMDIGNCWTVFNNGHLTVTKGFTGDLVVLKCSMDESVQSTLSISGGSPSSVTNEGGTVIANEALIGKLTTEGGSTSGTKVSISDEVVVEGGNVEIDVVGDIKKASVKGGTMTITGATSVSKASVEGGNLFLTSGSVDELSVEGGGATVSKAKVGIVSTEGGTVVLNDGASAKTFQSEGGTCTGCPKPTKSVDDDN